MKSQRYIFKASGKILLAGGYGILQEGNQGISLAVDRHFYSITSIIEGKGQMVQFVSVEVSSPQINQSWNLSYLPKENKMINLSKQNVFVEHAAKYALKYSLSQTKKSIQKIEIIILFDRGFLSETEQQKKKKDKFIVYDKNTSKTGLGSSACVVVSVIGGILKSISDQYTLDQINALSHLANISAQNKIGSNFDISTAIYGSQLYTNVLPKKASQVIKQGNIIDLMKIDPKIKRLKVNKVFKQKSCSWLIDLRKGSNTRTMISGFIKQLQQLSPELVRAFYQGNKESVQNLNKIICEEEETEKIVQNLKDFNRIYRKFLQKYTALTKVPVQPPEFNIFLDELLNIGEVVYCLCPGSGGYDAIFVLALCDNSEVREQVKEKISSICSQYQKLSQIQNIGIQWQPQLLSEKQLKEINNFLKH